MFETKTREIYPTKGLAIACDSVAKDPTVTPIPLDAQSPESHAMMRI